MAVKARLRVFAGPNGSGKSTILKNLDPEWIGCYVNADEIEKSLHDNRSLDLGSFDVPQASTQNLHAFLSNHPQILKAALADEVDRIQIDGLTLRFGDMQVNSYVAAAVGEFIRHELLAHGVTFTFETVMSHKSKVDFMRAALAKGYRTYLYFVATVSPDINVARVAERVSRGEHAVAEDLIRDRYRRSIDLLESAADAATRAYVFDNSGDSPVLIVEKLENGDFIPMVDQLPDWFNQSSLGQTFVDGGAVDVKPWEAR